MHRIYVKKAMFLTLLSPIGTYLFVPVNKTPIFQPTGDRNSPKFRFCFLEVATEQL